ncbi:UNVERIFIED_CONTAM: hypothetical protein Sradi_7155300, partial [Sesamum radiatum]
ALSCFFHAKEREGVIRGVAVPRNTPKVSHILLADDTLIFCQVTTDAIKGVRGVLDVYGQARGQLINLAKSSIVCSRNVHMAKRQELANTLGVRIDNTYEKYLELPSVVGKKNSDLFSCIRARM